MHLHMVRLLLLAGLSVAASPAPAVTKEAHEVFVQTGHAMSGTALAFSPDGKRLASCDGGGTVIAWDVESGLQYRTLQRHTGLCLAVDFSADGGYVYSAGGASSGQDIVLSRYDDGQTIRTWQGHAGLIVALKTTLGAAGVWSLGEQDGLWRWSGVSSEPLMKIALPAAQHGAATTLAMDAQQRVAWVGTRSGQVLRVDLASRQVQPLHQASGPLSSLQISPDGRQLAFSTGSLAGGNEHAVWVVDARDGQLIRRLEGHEGNVAALAFSPDGQTLASAAQMDLQVLLDHGLNATQRHEAVRIWKLTDHAPPQVFYNTRGAQGTPFLKGQLSFDRSGEQLALALWDEAVRVYQKSATSWVQQHVLEGRGVAARQMVASEAQNRLAVSEGRVRVQKSRYLTAQQVFDEITSGQPLTDAQAERIRVLYSERGFRRHAQHLSVWDLQSGRLAASSDWQLGPTTSLGVNTAGEFSSIAPLFPDTITVAPLKPRLIRHATLNAQDETAYLHLSYEQEQGDPNQVLSEEISAGPARVVTATALTEDGQRMVVASSSAGTQQQAAVHAISLLSRQAQGIEVQGVEAQPGQTLAKPMQARWQLDHQLPLAGQALAVALSPTGDRVWVSSTLQGLPYQDAHVGVLEVFDHSSGRSLQRWTLPRGITAASVLVHAGGDSAVTSGHPDVMLWRLGNADPAYMKAFDAADRPVRAMALSRSGGQLAVASTAGQLATLHWGIDGLKRLRDLGVMQPAPRLLSWLQQDKRLALASDDGAIRLLQAQDGSEVVRMIQFDDAEWISILPQGYFAASADGDRWLNVRIKGKVYRISQFYDVFYRPDLVQRQLNRQAIDDLITVTLQDALQRPAPAVQLQPLLLKPPSGRTGMQSTTRSATQLATQSVSLAISAHDQGGGLGELRVLHNGKLVEVLNKAPNKAPPAHVAAQQAGSATPGLPSMDDATLTRSLQRITEISKAQAQSLPRSPHRQAHYRVQVELVPGDNQFTVIASNAAGDLSSRPQSVSVQAEGETPAPRLWLLAVGVDHFKHSEHASALQYAAKDAQDFSQYIQQKLGTGFAGRLAGVLLLNEHADRRAVEQALTTIQQQAKPQDVFVWFLASHGTLDAASQYGLVLHDWDGRADASSLYSADRILDATRRIKAFRQLVILDTCHAGGVQGLVRGLYDARFSVLARNMGLHLFASASATQEALDGYRNNGLFTHTLLKAMDGGSADQDQDRQLSVTEWGAYARAETARIAKLLRHRQEPLMMSYGKDIRLFELQQGMPRGTLP
ncbi:hypothetical protein ED236_01465 [Pseudomethylobacillus aquaticus]|uniref:Peptidase C14 caspase domain-containing protein n=1 Tax=Pseudomethylobacillus aquaticus TaxID=2676064 RepID=A0A3N0V5Y4_9PROT|nr:caspase family protein [Pseudomethylobacillus aquaticus]ROH88169.1 hypothetical protein ED236_01465 [Pseudomethylobacillus aquaticus]